MFIVVNGDSDYSDYESFMKIIDELKDSMLKMDKELTMFAIGPSNILDIVDKYCIDNEQVREKRIKYYSYNLDQIKSYGMSRFNYYLNLTTDGVIKTKIEDGFSIV